MARRNKQNVEPKIGQDGAALTDDRKKQLHGYITEIERWNAEKAVIQADIGQIFNSAKDAGFDTKAMRAVINTRKKSRAEREAFDAVVDVYMHALGDFCHDRTRAGIHSATLRTRSALRRGHVAQSDY